jgi:hypothetical protein
VYEFHVTPSVATPKRSLRTGDPSNITPWCPLRARRTRDIDIPFARSDCTVNELERHESAILPEQRARYKRCWLPLPLSDDSAIAKRILTSTLAQLPRLCAAAGERDIARRALVGARREHNWETNHESMVHTYSCSGIPPDSSLESVMEEVSNTKHDRVYENCIFRHGHIRNAADRSVV